MNFETPYLTPGTLNAWREMSLDFIWSALPEIFKVNIAIQTLNFEILIKIKTGIPEERLFRKVALIISCVELCKAYWIV